MQNGFLKNNRPAMFLFLIAGFIIGAYFILTTKVGLSSADIINKIQQLMGANIPIVTNDKIDTDHDGLSDVLEKKYGTDPTKADTDGDGYLDGEEILAGTDPLKAGPNDKLTPAGNKNLTDLFSSVLTNGLKNQDSQNTSLANLPSGDLTNQIRQIFLPLPITASQIKISADNSEASLKSYLAAVENIVDKNYYQVVSNSSVDNGAPTYQMLARAGEKTFDELNKLTVPSSLTEKHIDILNTLLILKNIDNALSDESDSVKKLTALKAAELLFNN